MIKYFLAAFLLLFPLLAVAQLDSSIVVFRFDGGYADGTTTNGAASVTNTRNWNIGLKVGLALGKHWEAGIGCEYEKARVWAKSDIYIPKHYLAGQYTKTNLNLISGKIYLAGHWQLFKRLYFNPVFSAKIGKATENMASSSFGLPIVDYSSEPDQLHEMNDSPVVENTYKNVSYDLFDVSLAPAFSYYLNRHFALHLEIGSFAFATMDWKWDNKQWLATVNPTYWQLGVTAMF